MGRALLLLCLGSFIIFAMIQQAVNQRQLVLAESNVRNFEILHARNSVNSALEMGLHRILHEEWKNTPLPWSYLIDDQLVTVTVHTHEDRPDEIPRLYYRIRSEIILGNRTIEAFAFLKQASILPRIEGAVGFYGPGSELKIGGNAKIFGHDTNPDNTAGPEGSLPGIVSLETEDELINRVGAAARFEGDPNFLQQNLESEQLTEMIDFYKSNGVVYSSASDLGTVANPAITIINQDRTITGNTHAAGILYVDGGKKLTLRGTFVFEGLIIVQGELDIAGNVSIYGAVMFADNSHLELDPTNADFTGNESIYYSSAAIRNLQDKLQNEYQRSITLDRIFY